jgi:hypothetical protein
MAAAAYKPAPAAEPELINKRDDHCLVSCDRQPRLVRLLSLIGIAFTSVNEECFGG